MKMITPKTLLKSEINQVQETVPVEINPSQCILRSDFETKLSIFSKTESEYSEKAIVLDSINVEDSTPMTTSIDLSFVDPQNETMTTLSNDKLSSVSEAAICSSGNREDVSVDEGECDSVRSAHLPQDETLVHRSQDSLESSHISDNLKDISDTSKAPAGNTDSCRLPQLSNEPDMPVSNTNKSSSDIDTICFKLDISAGNDNRKDIATVSGEELHDAVCVSAISDNVHNSLRKNEHVDISEKDAPHFFCNALQPDIALIGSKNTSMFNNSGDLNGGSSSDGAVEALTTVNEALSTPLINKPLKSLSMPLTSLKIESASDKENLVQMESSYRDTESGETGEIHSSVNIGTNCSVEKNTVGLLLDDKRTSDDESCKNNRDLSTSCEKESLKYRNIFLESIDSDEDDHFRDNLSCEKPSPNKLVTSSGFSTKMDCESIGALPEANSSLNIVDSSVQQFSEHQSVEKLCGDPREETEEGQVAVNLEENDNCGNQTSGDVAIVTEMDTEDVAQVQVEKSDKDEGELSDDDVEEGEIKEPGDKKPSVKTLCQFFQKGSCTWGISCSFLHPGINDKGNYQMIEVPGFTSLGARVPRLGIPGTWPEDKTMASARYTSQYNPLEERFEQDRFNQREPYRPGASPISRGYTPPLKQADEWTDPWTRSKSSQYIKKDKKLRSLSKGRRKHRSVSDYSHSSRSSSGSSSSSSRSRSRSSSSNSSRSKTPKPVPPSVDRFGRYLSPSREQSRGATSPRASRGYHNNQANGYSRNTGSQRGGSNLAGSGGRSYNSYDGASAAPGFSYTGRDRSRDRTYRRARSPHDRPLPYTRPRPDSASSSSDSSRSRSRSTDRKQSKTGARSSRLRSSSSSSTGSEDIQGLGSPSNHPKASVAGKKSRPSSRKNSTQGAQKQPDSSAHPHFNLDEIPHPSDPKPPQPVIPAGDPKFGSGNAAQTIIKAKDPVKVVGRKSNIRLTLPPKNLSLGSLPNPLDSPPHVEEVSDSDASPTSDPPEMKVKLPITLTTAQKLAPERATKVRPKTQQGKSLLSSIPLPPSLNSVPHVKAAVYPQKQEPNSGKSHVNEPTVAKTAPKTALASSPVSARTGSKVKKITSSQREQLLRHLKEVEDAIARKRMKLQ